jgi:hypothetical protein
VSWHIVALNLLVDSAPAGAEALGDILRR